MVALNEIRHPNRVIEDEYACVKTVPIIYDGLDTGYDMTWKRQNLDGKEQYVPTGAVSRGYTPIMTSDVVRDIMDNLQGRSLFKSMDSKVAAEKTRSTLHKVRIVMEHPIEVPVVPRDAGSRFAPETNTGRFETFYPTLVLQNSYNGISAIKGSFGLWRSICLNGMEAPILTGSTHQFHTVNGIQRFTDRFINQDWRQAINRLTMLVKSTSGKKLTEEQMELLLPKLSKKDVKTWTEEYPDHSQLGMLNFLSYQRTHVATISSEVRYQAAINDLVEIAA